MNNYVEQIMRFRESKKTNIAIFRPVEYTDEALYRDIAEVCESEGTVEIVNEGFLNSFEAIGKGLVDILIVPELESLHLCLFYTLKKYIESGGAIITACDDYFMTEQCKTINYGTEETYYRESTAYLGIKPYVSDVTPVLACADTCWIEGAETSEGELPKAGVQLNVSSDRVAPKPPFGNLFIERYEVLRNYDAVIGCDKYGNKINSQVTFAQNWETKARYAMYSSNQKNSLIRKDHPLFEKTLKAAVRFCKNKVFAISCEPNFACYKQGESVAVTYKFENEGTNEQTVDVMLKIVNDNGICVHHKKETVCLKGNSAVTETECWKPDNFECDSYSVVLELYREGRLLSKAENGFVVWIENVIKNGPTISVNGKYFYIDGKSSIITGTNYYESNIGEVMWIKPNIKKLESDFKQMSADGINFIRIHYHHAKWFIDYLKNCTGQVFDYYKDIQEGYLPSERILRIFDAHIYLAQKYHIVYGGDLFTLRPEEMGEPRGWMQVQDFVKFEDKLKAQKEFLELLIPRYIDVPGIAWDIYNEPGVGFGALKWMFDEEFHDWAAKIKEYMRELGDTHVVVVGAAEPERFDGVSEFYAEHGNFKDIRIKKTETPLPEVIQECWLDRPQTPQGEQGQLDDIRQALFDVLEMGFAGFLPWQWTNQQRLWCDWRTGNPEVWDDRLGACVRNDGTLKPSGRFYRDLIWFLEGLDFISYQDSTVTTSFGDMVMDCECGNHRIRLINEGETVREWALNKIVGKTMEAEADRESDLFYISYPEADYIKANKACVLSVILQKTPAQIMVCEKPCGAEIVSKGTFESNHIELTVEESDVNYWFKIVY